MKQPDIVARLRDREAHWQPWIKEAADEIERLGTQCGGNCRYWEGRWRDEAELNAEAAAFLDVLADRCTNERGARYFADGFAADDCRAMAEKLRK